MSSSPKRRLGIDGLSPRSTHSQPNTPRVPHNPGIKQGHEHAVQQSKQQTDWQIAPASNPVSHPSLPLGHASLSYRRTSFLKKVLWYPIVQPFGRKVVLLSAMRLALSVSFWLVAVLPLIVHWLSPFSTATLIKARDTLGMSAIAQPAAVTSSLVVLVVFGLAMSLVAGAVTSQVIIAYKIRSIDHRKANTHQIIQVAFSKLLTSLGNGLLNFLMYIVGTVILLGVIAVTVRLHQGAIQAWQWGLIGVAMAAYVVCTFIMAARRPLQLSMFAVTDRRLRFIRGKSLGLVLANFLSSIPVVLFSLLGWVFFLSLVFAITWAEIVYLRQPSGLVGHSAVWLIGLVLLGVVWTLMYSWRRVYWASYYHALVMRGPKYELSAFLAPQDSIPIKRWPIVVSALLTIGVACLCVGATYVAWQNRSNIKARIVQTIPNTYRISLPDR